MGKIKSPSVFRGRDYLFKNTLVMVHDTLLKSGSSTWGSVLAYQINFCESAGLRYTIEYTPGKGYILTTPDNHEVTKVTITWAKLITTHLGAKTGLRLTLKTLEGEKIYYSVPLSTPFGLAILFKAMGYSTVDNTSHLSVSSLIRKYFYCRVKLELYNGKSYKRIFPLDVGLGTNR